MLIPGQYVHLVGIGGSGLSAIARVLLAQGYIVSGSDRQPNEFTAALAQLGATIYAGHKAENIGTAEVVIISSAIPADNPEVQAARARRVPVLKRRDVLGDLMVGYMGVAVAGTHGKTTTSSMIVHILNEARQDPTYIVGGIVPGTGQNAGLGLGKAFVVEADEYDHMFLGLKPRIGVITNVEHDHPDLFPTLADLVHDFNMFAALIPPDGVLVACADDVLALMLARNRTVVGWPVVTYGVSSGADWQAADWQATSEGGMMFTLWRRGEPKGRVMLRVPGIYNIQNAMAALIVTDRLGVPLGTALAGLASFTGANRRFEVRGQAGGVTIIDDYAHHPTAIKMTLAAARVTYPGAKIWAVWQPHTYSRLRVLFQEFAGAFEITSVDQVVITDVYAAREQVGPGPDVPDLMRVISHPAVRHVPALDDVVGLLAAEVKPGNVVLILSAGDAPVIGEQLLAQLSA